MQHHPWPAAIVGTVHPRASSRCRCSACGWASPTRANYNEDTTTRQAYELLADGFGPGYNGPFFLVAEVDEEADPAVLEQITADVAADPGVAFVTPAVPNT